MTAHLRVPGAVLVTATLGALLALPTVAGPIAAATPLDGSGPAYRADIATAAVAAGTTTETHLTITRLGGSDAAHPALRSVRIQAPYGFAILGASATQGATALPVAVKPGRGIFVTEAKLTKSGGRIDVIVSSQIPCGVNGDGAADWRVNARTSFHYTNPTGLDLLQDPASALTTVAARCSLAFVHEPALAGVNTAISSVDADPSGTHVAVRLLDGNGSPASVAGVAVSLAITPGSGTAGAGLTGGITDGTDGAGLATFAPRIDTAGHAYRLTATARPGITATTSDPFDITSVAVTCSGTCGGSGNKGTTSASVIGSTDGGVVTLSLGLDDVDCNDAANHFYQGTSEPISFNVTQGTGRTTVVITLAAASVTRSYRDYDVCFSSPLSAFTNRFHAAIAAGDAGLLPNCRRIPPVDDGDADDQPNGPCVEKRQKDQAGNVIVTFSVPAGDPRGKI